MSNQENFTITYDLEVKGESQVTQAIGKAIQAVEKMNRANETSAKAFKIAEQAGVGYDKFLNQFFDKATAEFLNAEEAGKRFAAAQEAIAKQSEELAAKQSAEAAAVKAAEKERLAQIAAKQEAEAQLAKIAEKERRDLLAQRAEAEKAAKAEIEAAEKALALAAKTEKAQIEAANAAKIARVAKVEQARDTEKAENTNLNAVQKSIKSFNDQREATQRTAQAYKVAETAGLHYSETMNRFFDKTTGKIVSQEQAAKRLAQANEGLAQKRGSGLDKGDLFDIAGNLGIGGDALGLFRDLTTASGLFGASLIAVSAGIGLVKGAIESNIKTWEAESAVIARTSNTLDEYIAKRKEAANESFGNKTSQIIQNLQAGLKAEVEDFAKNPFRSITEIGGPNRYDPNEGRVVLEGKKIIKEREESDFALGELVNERVKKLGEEVTKLGAEGASLNEIFQKTIEIKIATGEITKENAENADWLKQHGAEILKVAKGYRDIGAATGEVTRGQQQITKSQLDYQKQKQVEADAASAVANRLRGQLIDLQNQSNEAIENLAEQHQKRLASIAQNGASQRANIESNYAKQLENLAANLQEQRENIVSQNTERIVELEKQTQESRSKAIEDYAKRNGDIETAYQERIKAIQQNYSDSLFDIEARRDARALVAARKSRDKDIRDAEANREKDKKQAQDDYQTNQRNLETALKKQIETIRNDQAKRLEEAQNAYQKQLSAAQKARAEQLQALTRSLAEQRTAENRGYQESLTALQQQFANRRTALIQALASEANLTTEYGRKVIESLKGILNPREISDAIKQFQNAVNAKVTVKIEPITPVSNTSPSGTSGTQNAGNSAGYSYAEGGYIPSARYARLHANEVVLPLSNPARTQQLLKQYVAPRAGVMRQEVTGRIMVDGSAVDAAMKSQLSSELTRIFSEALTASNRG